jgi:hypothetical protein
MRQTRNIAETWESGALGAEQAHGTVWGDALTFQSASVTSAPAPAPTPSPAPSPVYIPQEPDTERRGDIPPIKIR